jgi:hypothetical protein
MSMEKIGVNEPYDRGVKSAQAGESVKSNPYERGTPDFSNWEDGWWDTVMRSKTDTRTQP